MPEALSKNVIDGTVVPWEVTTSLKLAELTDSHTEILGDRGLYTSVFLYAMNKAKWDSLPDDLKAIVAANSGGNIAAKIGQAWEDAEKPGREAAIAHGNKIIEMPAAEVEKLKTAAQPVIDAWVAEMTKNGADGAMLLQAARDLIQKHQM
jgi:TRAP-type C4-dicarboxylate transport system substrate-binding protein